MERKLDSSGREDTVAEQPALSPRGTCSETNPPPPPQQHPHSPQQFRMGNLPLAQTLGECCLRLSYTEFGQSWCQSWDGSSGGMKNGGQSSRLFFRELQGLTFFLPLSSSGLSSRTPGDKPVAHVVGKSSADGLGDVEQVGCGGLGFRS